MQPDGGVRKIAVVGCGAVGSFYGASLARAGLEVHFLLRSDYEAVRKNGVHIRSPRGDFHVRPQCARLPAEIGRCDLVVIGLKTTANDQFGTLLPPLVGPATALLTLQNGLGNEEQLARRFPPTQIMGGLCFVCLNRVAPGVIHHIGYGQVVIGEFQRPPEARTRAIATLFDRAGVPCSLTEDLARAHWEKLVWNIPFNGLGVAGIAGYELFAELLASPPKSAAPPFSDPSARSARIGLPAAPPATEGLYGLTTDKLLADANWGKLVRELMLEVIAAARAVGFDIPESYADEHIARTRNMGAYKASTLIDFERGQPLELESLFLEPLRLARQAGLAMPILSALCVVLAKLAPAGSCSPAR